MIQDLEISRRGENNFGQRNLKEHEKNAQEKAASVEPPKDWWQQARRYKDH